jgi:hypothetical protein
VQNEWNHPWLQEGEVASIVAAVKAADPLRNTTASGTGGYLGGTFARNNGLDLVAYHDPRNQGTWFTEPTAESELNAIRAELAPFVKPIDFQEPMPFGNGPAGCSSTFDPTPTHARNAATFAKKYGASIWTFHTRRSFTLAGTTLEAALDSEAGEKAELEAIKPAANTQCWGANLGADILNCGDSLSPGETVTSADGRFYLEYQSDGGNLVLRRVQDGATLWAANCWPTCLNWGSPGDATMQNDGNFVVHNGGGTPVWWTGTDVNQDSHLKVQIDGNVVIYSRNGVVLWNTMTCCQ